MDEAIQSDLFEKNNIQSNPARYDENKGKLPIPYTYDDFKRLTCRDSSTNTAKPQERAVAFTTNHLFTDYSSKERLLLYEYAIEQSKKLGFNATSSGRVNGSSIEDELDQSAIGICFSISITSKLYI